MAKNVTSDELWDYFSENREALAKEYQMIASDEEQGVEIYLAEDRGFPCFSVEVDGEEVYTIETYSCLDAEKTYDQLLDMYVYPDVSGYEDIESANDRAQEVTCAVEDMLWILLEEDPLSAGISLQDIDEIAFLIEQYLFDQYGLSVRHPTEVDGAVIQYPFGDPSEGEDEESAAADS